VMPTGRSGLPVARYLWPEEKVVPFRTRPELDELLGWCGSGGRAAVRLVTGDGGAGKTRLALQLGEKLVASGRPLLWVPRGAELEGVQGARDLAKPCLLVVDYAETRTELVGLLNEVASYRDGPDLRVLLLARSAGEWWRQLLADAEKRTAALLEAALPVTLGPVPAAGGPHEVFAEALTAFARRLGVARPDARLVLAEPDPVVLVVHAAALLAVVDHATEPHPQYQAASGPEVLKGLLGHEARYWQRAASGRGLNLDLGVLRLAVAVACLIGAENETSAAALLSCVPDLDSGERRGQVARWLRDLYPEASLGQVGVREWIGPLRPDLVAEYLVVAELDNRPDLTPRLFTNLSDERAARALTVLARAAYTQPPALDLLRGALAADLEHMAVPALSVAVETNPVLGVLLSEALDSQQVSARTLEQIANTARYPSVALAAPAAVVFKRLAANSANPIERAMRLVDLSNWLGALERRAEALAAIEEAVGFYRRLDDASSFFHQLAGADLAGVRPSLATSLNTQSDQLVRLGRREEALAAIEESTSIYRPLAAADPDVFRPNLAASLNNQAQCLAALGRREEALAAIEETANIYRRLAGADPDVFRPNLAASLNNQAQCLAALGRREEALATVEEAVSIHRQLAEADLDAFLPGLADSLSGQARRMRDLGRWKEALAPIEEAVRIYRQLAHVRSGFSRNLASSLDVLAAILSALGRTEGAGSLRAEADSIRMPPEQKELMHTGLLITEAYLSNDSEEQARLIGSFLPEPRRFSRLADAFTYVAIFATEVIAAVQEKSFYEALYSISENTEVLLLPDLPVGPWDEVLLLADAVKVGGDYEARRVPLTMDVVGAINVTFRLAVSALTDLAKVPQFAHMTPLTMSEMLIDAVERGVH
jgi:tetratricopeptide (TPR) repeat protein